MLVMMLMANMLTGCSKTDKDGETGNENSVPEEVVPTGIYVPVADITTSEFEGFRSGENYCWQGDTVLYARSQTDQATRKDTRILYKKSLDGLGEPEVVFQEGTEGRSFSLFFTDREDNVYLFGKEKQGEENRYYFSKTDKEGQQIFISYPEDESLKSNLNLSKGFVDGNGNSYLYDHMNSIVLFFDKEGNYIGSGKGAIKNGDMVDAGEGNVFLWGKSYEQNGIEIQRLDCEKAAISEEEIVTFSNISERFDTYSILSGYEEGALLSTSGKLYRFDFSTGEAEELLNWDDGNVNVDGSMAESIRSLKRNEQGNLEFEVLLNSWITNEAEIAKISYVDQAYVPQKQVITFGANSTTMILMREMVQKFNRGNQKYQLKMIEFDDESIREALLYGKGEIPDLLDAGIMPLSMLQKKGLLADLTPYFEKSDVVRKEDILESVWEASLVNGTMVRAVMSYTINIYATHSDAIKESGYTAEDIVAMQQANPESRLLDYCSPRNIIRLVIGSQMDRFVDWENRKANFDSKEFIALLETLGGIYVPDDPSLGRNQKVFSMDEEVEKFLNGEFLMRVDAVSAPYLYQQNCQMYQDKAHYIGSPTLDGKPCFEIFPQREFCIYEKSEHKDGAWAVIEYMLSEELQNWYGNGRGNFPVRKDAFLSYLERPYGVGEIYEKTTTEEQYRQELKYMSDYFYINDTDEDLIILDVLSDETQAFFAGDKSAQEVAQIIQSRVQNYMDEQ